MPFLRQLYRHSFGPLTDLYELTMACGYWKNQMADREAVFHLSFRQAPFGGRFAVACGIGEAVELISKFGFDSDDLEYLATLEGTRGRPLFEPEFLEYLSRFRFRGDVSAVREGTIVFPHEPLLRVTGPLIESQLLETALLTIVNFQTLIATKATRVCQAAEGQPVLEFGLRRAQGIDGGVSASRAAVVGGCVGTSNVLAGKLFDVPVRGTHAHSWVMSFDNERESFQAYADAMPDNCIFLVDTYNTTEGVRHAIEVAGSLRDQGHAMIGVRLDSGDIAELSRQTRRMLDDAGFPDAQILASGDLDEYEIRRLKRDGALVDIWGVGTRLATAYDQPALGGIYKLAAIQDERGEWNDRLKLSDEAAKVSTPGIHQTRRYFQGSDWRGDLIYDERRGITHPPAGWTVDGERSFSIGRADRHEDLLAPVVRRGEVASDFASVMDAQRFVRQQLQTLDRTVTRLDDPAEYRVGLEQQLHHRKQEMIKSVRKAYA